FRVDVQAAKFWLSLNWKSPGLDKGAKKGNLSNIAEYAKQFFHMGIFAKTATRLMRQRWPDDEFAEPILSQVHQVYTLGLALRPQTFGKDSVVDANTIEQALLEEPSDFDGSRLE